jgi:hypothetical protein
VEFIRRVFDVMARAYWHRFHVLTKRAERLAVVGSELTWASNVWMGVSVESDRYRHRVDCLRATPAHTRFLSLEPLLGPIHDLNLSGIDWVIVGGESGPGARPMREEWAADVRDQCARAAVPFFFKQWGGRNKKATGRVLQGRVWDEMRRAPAMPVEGRSDVPRHDSRRSHPPNAVRIPEGRESGRRRLNRHAQGIRLREAVEWSRQAVKLERDPKKASQNLERPAIGLDELRRQASVAGGVAERIGRFRVERKA